MAKNRIEHIEDYRKAVKAASKEATKKELFKDLLNRLYADVQELIKIINAISAGAEATIVNIPRKDKLHKGSADTLYNKVIIEFENDLKITQKHAKEQLAGYLLGQFHSGEGYNFTLIVSDFITWKVFCPDVSQLTRLEELKEDEVILNEVESASFTLTENNADEFYYWIDRFLFKEEKQKATLKRIEEAFGYQSNIFIECFRGMERHFQDVKKFGEVQVSYEQWKRFLSIAYGSFDASESNFLIHTYLSVFSKMLAYSVVSNDDYIDDKELFGIIEGSIFHRYNIRNFVDNDFFHWVKNDRTFRALKKVFRLIAQEISTFHFQDVEEDVLKGVYQELIDLDTRHALGEYYTPDWLCERIVNEFTFKPSDKILDPACGSGSFLRAAIHRLKTLHPAMTAEEINNNIYGIDIHPLSVQIAKTTVLLAMGKEIVKSKNQIHLNIILANTLLSPIGKESIFGNEFSIQIDKKKYLLNTQVLVDNDLYDKALDLCEELAEYTLNSKSELLDKFETKLKQSYPKGGFNGNVSSSFFKVYEALKEVKEKKRDSIWKFILQNFYKPYFIKGKFDYIIGNPPWFTFRTVKSEEYQNILNALADIYGVKPDKVATFPQLEIAAIFLSYCSSYFLNENGKLVFVLPRSFLNADQHDNTRRGKAKGFRITQIWDMENVSPLFRILCCVLFAEKAEFKKSIPASGLPGKLFSGRIPTHNSNLKNASSKLIEKDVKWFYAKQGGSSAISMNKTKVQTKTNPYRKLFKNGATIFPRNFYFVEVNMAYEKGWEKDFDWSDRVINLKTADSIIPDGKEPWKETMLKGFMPSKYIFRTALSKSILPFALFKPNLIVLPIEIQIVGGKKKVKLLKSIEIPDTDAAKWFGNVQNIWAIHRTEKNKNISATDYLNWQNKLTSQNLNLPYLVLYNSSAKDANATIVKRSDLDLDFFVDGKAYWFATANIHEAYYLTAILNAALPNLMMKDFQTKGLFGARDVSKRILDIYYPKFDEKDKTHLRLAELSKEAHRKAAQYLKNNAPKEEISGIRLGKMRTDIKKHLAGEMKEIDGIVKGLIEN